MHESILPHTCKKSPHVSLLKKLLVKTFSGSVKILWLKIFPKIEKRMWKIVPGAINFYTLTKRD